MRASGSSCTLDLFPGSATPSTGSNGKKKRAHEGQKNLHFRSVQWGVEGGKEEVAFNSPNFLGSDTL